MSVEEIDPAREFDSFHFNRATVRELNKITAYLNDPDPELFFERTYNSDVELTRYQRYIAFAGLGIVAGLSSVFITYVVDGTLGNMTSFHP